MFHHPAHSLSVRPLQPGLILINGQIIGITANDDDGLIGSGEKKEDEDDGRIDDIINRRFC